MTAPKPAAAIDLEPEQVELRALDIVPYEAAIWCTVGGGKPFANTIEHRSWLDDGQHIWFLLGTHNTYKAAPDDMVRVVLKPRRDYMGAKKPGDPLYDNEAFLAKRPRPQAPCAHCGGTGEGK
jgi:hypothetical protein